ncbi:MAG: UDP-N-acetylmuramyl-tripeptide synthetase, partial [bacterium]|nr:UDP-N-acetylmuramyl-tripeptide synthetase [bacterium]
EPQMTFGFSDEADVRIIDSHADWTKTEISVLFQGKTIHFTSTLTGFFNVYNMTALVAGALSRDISEIDIQRGFDTVSVVPGRMEQVTVSPDFAVVVDYAHTPDALENVLTTAKKLTTGSLHCVFGCGGDRDRAKRPLMAEAVVRNCDEAIVTNDNPRTEKPQAIIRDILEGIPLDYPHQVITDRREAIKKALTCAQKGDCVVIAGKGHETYQEINGVRHHFDDREVVRELGTEMEHISDNG